MKATPILAWRLLKGRPSRIWLFVFCIAVGVAARVSIGSFLASLDTALGLEARSLLTADVEVASGAPITGALREKMEAALPAGSQRAQRISLLTMAAGGRGKARSRLVQLSAVGPRYPLVGTLKVRGADGEALGVGELQKHPWAYAQGDLLAQLGLRPGDTLRIGSRDFILAGVIEEEPGLGGGAFSLGPRVLVGIQRPAQAGLIGFGSRASFEDFYALADPATADAVVAALKTALGVKDRPRFRGMAPSPDSIQVRGTKDAVSEVRRFFERLADFLNLVSLMALLLGGIGVASVTRGFVREAAVQLGILRSVGAAPARVSALFAWQAAALGLLGGSLGALVGTLLQAALPGILQELLPMKLAPVFSVGSIAWGLGLGLLSALAFGLEPALVAERQTTAALLRDEDAVTGLGPKAWALRLVGTVAFAALAAWESRSWTRGPGFFAALLLGALLLQAAAALLLPRLARLRRPAWPFAVRQAFANLGRPGLRAGATVVALGSAALLLGVLAVHQYSLLTELDPGKRGTSIPDLFLLDVQADQVESLRKDLAARPGSLKVELSPMVRARYRGKLGASEAELETDASGKTREKEDDERMRSREQNLSWRSELGGGEEIVAGRWMDVDGDEVEASLEEWYAKRLNAGLGDILRFEVQGVEVQARITSLRKVHWGSFKPNFFILLSPWALQDAPQTWIGSIGGVGDAGQRADLQAELSGRYRNLTLFDMADSLKKILGILHKISGAVSLVAAFCLATGLVVLAGLALATARGRRAEAALLKVLGAGRSGLLWSVGLEFGLLSALAALLGLSLALLFGWVLMTKVIDLPFVAPWAALGRLALLFTLTGSAVGLLSSWRVFQAKPSEVLRED